MRGVLLRPTVSPDSTRVWCMTEKTRFWQKKGDIRENAKIIGP